jgi:hypothetical protein
VEILAKGSSSMRNVEGDALRESKTDGVEGVGLALARANEFGCLGADCERARESDFGGAVAGAVGEV